MKKILLLILCTGLNSCYYVTEEQDWYGDEDFYVTETPYYVSPEYQGQSYTSAGETIYVTPMATSSVIYVEQPEPQVTYVETYPEVVYDAMPLPPVYRPYQDFVPPRSRHVGTTPRKHIGGPIVRKPKPVMKPPRSRPHSDAEGRR